jgi:hypothetical protein
VYGWTVDVLSAYIEQVVERGLSPVVDGSRVCAKIEQQPGEARACRIVVHGSVKRGATSLLPLIDIHAKLEKQTHKGLVMRFSSLMQR